MAEKRAEVLSLEIHQVLNILPHRFPFVMVDRVNELVAGKYARGHKCVSYNEPFFPGHFPQRPIMPGMLILESLAQLGGILAYVSEPFDPTTNLLYFRGVNNVKFRRTVVPGDRMDLYVEVAQHTTNAWGFAGEVTVEGTLCVEGELLATVVDVQP